MACIGRFQCKVKKTAQVEANSGGVCVHPCLHAAHRHELANRLRVPGPGGCGSPCLTRFEPLTLEQRNPMSSRYQETRRHSLISAVAMYTEICRFIGSMACVNEQALPPCWNRSSRRRRPPTATAAFIHLDRLTSACAL